MVKESLKTRWLREVTASVQNTDSVRVLLMVMHRHMREDGYVSIKRELLLAELGRTDRRVASRLADAVAAGYLDRVSAGYPGRAAVYRAIDKKGDVSQHPFATAERHPSPDHAERGTPKMGAAERRPSSKTNLVPRKLCVVRGANRDELRADLARLRRSS